MATNNDSPVVDKDKEVLLDVRGIIDGCIESGSTDYKSALQEIIITIGNHGIALPPIL